MAQVSRLLRRLILRSMPAGARARLLDRSPNWRKAAPFGQRFRFDRYLGDVQVDIDTTFLIDRLMWSGEFEPYLMALIRRHVRPGDTCLDVGANIGASVLALAKAVGDDGRVHAFEPAPPNLERLRRNLSLNPALERRVTIHPVGVSDQAGRLFWRNAPGNPGNGFLGETGEHEVPVATLDERLQTAGVRRADFMKVDVEGMELNVFRGGTRTLDTLRPCLYFETLSRFERSAGGGLFSETENYLRGKGYELYRIENDGSVAPASSDNWSSYAWAVPKEKVAQFGR